MSLNVGIFCGSKTGVDDSQKNMTKELASWLGKRNINIVFGGSDIGLMEVLVKEASKFNIKIYGIIPKVLVPNYLDKKFTTELIVTRSLDQRKKQFLIKSDFFIALPGGIGTLNEIFDLMVKRELKEIDKKLFLINEKKFWNPLIKLINHSIKQGFLDEKVFNSVIEISSFKNTIKKIQKLYA